MKDKPQQYRRVATRFWSDVQAKGWSDDAKVLALYVLTSPHRTTEGLFRLPKAYIADDLGWSLERLAQPFGQLLADGFIDYDEKVSVMLVTKALAYQQPENPNQVTAAIRALTDLPPSPRLTSTFKGLAERFCQRLAEELPEGFGEGFAQPPPPPPPPPPSPSPPSAAGDDEASTSPSPDVSAAFGADVPKLCEQLADRIEANGSKRPRVSKAWLTECDRMLRLDGRTPTQVAHAIDWCQADPFWRANVLSMPKLREQFDKLRLAAMRNGAKAPNDRRSSLSLVMEMLENEPAEEAG